MAGSRYPHISLPLSWAVLGAGGSQCMIDSTSLQSAGQCESRRQIAVQAAPGLRVCVVQQAGAERCLLGMWQQVVRGVSAGIVGWLRSRLPPVCHYGRTQQRYGERNARALIRGLRYRSRPGRTGRLLAALTGAFLWEEERVREEEILR